MSKIKFILDPVGNTLNLWWKQPSKTDFVEESRTSNDVIIYGKDGKPKGIEIIGFFPQELNIAQILGLTKTTGLLKGKTIMETVE